MLGQQPPELHELGRIRQLAEHQQVRGLRKRRVLGQFLDRVAAVAQDALLAVDERDAARARAGVRVPVVERDQPRLRPQLRDVHRALVFRTHDHRKIVALAAVRQCRLVAHACTLNSSIPDQALIQMIARFSRIGGGNVGICRSRAAAALTASQTRPAASPRAARPATSPPRRSDPRSPR